MLKRFSVTDDFTRDYLEYGCVILTDLFDPDEVKAIQDEILEIFAIRFSSIGIDKPDPLSLVKEHYDDAKEAWRECAKWMQNSILLSRAASKKKLTNVLSTVGLAKSMISPLPEVRIDMPDDDNYRQPWHQDWRTGQGSLNSLTIWLPLHNVDAKCGAISAIPSSHLWGLCETEVQYNPRRFISVDARIEKEMSFVAELQRGECLLFSQMLVHGSGFNRSGEPRMTCQLRYSDLSEAAFLENGLQIAQSDELIWSNPPTGEKMRMVYSQ
ncbi:phytanoyl-CoA dioxygenase family protein [Kiloniella sp.]|uniref:phytanoyl-CoA dioxygenase family protein n=1 Tax=Kiloniella sp. TaxID=1938587 RepID=UPI003A9439B5